MLGVERLLAITSELNFGVHGKPFANSSSPRLSHASGMGTARRDVALLATTRRNQFPGFIRSRHAGVASDGRGADRIGTSLYQYLQRRTRSRSARNVPRVSNATNLASSRPH